jgi:caffeoyl-CoA O-methyltransferase
MTVYNEEMSSYITNLFAIQDQALRSTLELSSKNGLPTISIKPEEGRFLQFLVHACGVHKALEIGTLGGYSGIWIARGLLPGGKLITLEREPGHAEVARKNFASAGVLDKVELRLGDAHELLPALVAEAPFDMIFIDAEKTGYPAYFDWAMENLRLGGVIAIHNAFRKGSIIQQAQDDAYTAIMIAFNQSVASDTRLIATIYPAGDGTLIAVKRT